MAGIAKERLTDHHRKLRHELQCALVDRAALVRGVDECWHGVPAKP
eukprot:COSAG02_NODE_48831_length_331_cov_0.672414_2_plen_45_part_01